MNRQLCIVDFQACASRYLGYLNVPAATIGKASLGKSARVSFCTCCCKDCIRALRGKLSQGIHKNANALATHTLLGSAAVPRSRPARCARRHIERRPSASSERRALHGDASLRVIKRKPLHAKPKDTFMDPTDPKRDLIGPEIR